MQLKTNKSACSTLAACVVLSRLHFCHDCISVTTAFLSRLHFCHDCISVTIVRLHFCHDCISVTTAFLSRLHFCHDCISVTTAFRSLIRDFTGHESGQLRPVTRCEAVGRPKGSHYGGPEVSPEVFLEIQV